MKRYDSTDGSDLRMRIKGEENVAIVEVCVVGSIRIGRTEQCWSNGSMRNIRKENRVWSTDDTRQIKGFFVVLEKRNWYEVQSRSGRKRGAERALNWMSITKPKYSEFHSSSTVKT